MVVIDVTNKKENSLSRYPSMYKVSFEDNDNKNLFTYLLIKKDTFGEWFLNNNEFGISRPLDTTNLDKAIILANIIIKKLLKEKTETISSIIEELDDEYEKER